MEISRVIENMPKTGENKKKASGLLKKLKNLRKNRCRDCPKRVKSEEKSKKRTTSLIKKKSFDCEFCCKRFESKSYVVAHTKSSHSKLLILEKMAERIFKGITLNGGKSEGWLEKYSTIR